MAVPSPSKTALVLVDMQNDFLHPEGAYGRAGQHSHSIVELPDRLAPLATTFRAAGAWIVSTHFTLVPGKDGEPYISGHLRTLRPFLGRGDFAPGGTGHALIDELAPSHIQIEKVAFSAFYQSRMEWVLRKFGIETLVFGGIVTNGGVASTIRDAHARDFHSVLLEDGCGAFGVETHETAIRSLANVADICTCAEVASWWV
ncbi:MAG: cysteine hydrolase [Pseudomonadota bacterium]|nr:cysteine hydrolase [Pseudomonadota bacterium]